MTKSLNILVGAGFSYYFGSPMPGRQFNNGSYRYGFNGQEKDNEIAGTGNIMTAEFWEYDSRLGRRWNVDPIKKPWESVYAAFSNSPIWCNDVKGLDANQTGNKGKEKEKNEEKEGPIKAGDKIKMPDGSIFVSDVDEAVVSTKKIGFWGRVGNFFSRVANSFINTVKKADDWMRSLGPKMRKIDPGKWLHETDEEQGLEHQNNDHIPDGSSSDVEGDGKISPENAPSKVPWPFSVLQWDDKEDYKDPMDIRYTPVLTPSTPPEQSDSIITMEYLDGKGGLTRCKVKKEDKDKIERRVLILQGPHKGEIDTLGK